MRALIFLLVTSPAHAFGILDFIQAGEKMTESVNETVHIGGAGWWNKKAPKLKNPDDVTFIDTYTTTVCTIDGKKCYQYVQKHVTRHRVERE